MVEHAKNMTTKYHHMCNKTIHIYIITQLLIVYVFSVVMIQIAGMDIRSHLLFEASLINLARRICLKYFVLISLNVGHVKTKWYSLSNANVLHNSQFLSFLEIFVYLPISTASL